MVEEPRVNNYHPPTIGHLDGQINYISTLDNNDPVTVRYHHYNNNYCIGEAYNLFEIIKLFKEHVPESEDWFINKQAGFDFNEPLRNRNMRKYTKGLVYNIMIRLCHHHVFTCFDPTDIIKESYHGEEHSYFRPYQTIHASTDGRTIL